MKIRELLNMTRDDLETRGAIRIVAFGDSVTHGAQAPGVIDFDTVYWNRLKRKLNAVRSYVPINVINSGIGGTSATSSLMRVDRDVISYHPDLVIVCFGLNDMGGPYEQFITSLREIFAKCKACGAEVIYLSPNMMNTYVAPDTREDLKEYAAFTADKQTSGHFDKYIASAIAVAREAGVTVCDCYGEWKNRYEQGEDVTMLLANRINHPTAQMHELFAQMLFDTIMGGDGFVAKDNSSTMADKAK